MDPGTIRVLIGEEDFLEAAEMQEELEGIGYRVTIKAGTPREVVSFATEHQPDAIILDLHLGGDTHGVEVSRDIHDVTKIPTIFLSAFPDDMANNEHAVPRPYRYVIRPFTAEEVHAAIQEMLTDKAAQTAHG